MMCDISIVKEYKLCDDIWHIIKEYMGVAGGIKLTIPKLLSDTWAVGLYRILMDDVLYPVFYEGLQIVTVIDSNEVKKTKMIKTIYAKYRLLNRCKKDAICDRLEQLLQPPAWLGKYVKIIH